MDELLTRRNTLLRLAGLVGAGLGIEALKAGEGPAGVASGAVKCVLTPEQTEGPFYIENEKMRRNITDGRRGTPLTLRATVVDASTCKPIKGAAVDIWHCDAGGVYSGFGQGASSRTFLRGMQRTNASGLALLKTIYRLVPGTHRAHPREGPRRRKRRTHRPALLPGLADGQGLPEGAVQVAAGTHDAQLERLRLCERRQELDGQRPRRRRRRLRRVDHDGRRQELAVKLGEAFRFLVDLPLDVA